IPIGKRTATTKLVVADQQTVVIGGLIRNVTTRAEQKIPVLGDIPVLGALFERKMQERQEYLDRYFVFSDSSDYKPPKDWSRTNGLVEDIRQSYFQLEERKRLDEITKPRELKTHDPQRPLEMPQGTTRPAGAAGGAPGAFPAPPPATHGGATPPVN